MSKKNELNPTFVSPSDVSDLKHEINDETLLINNEINESVSGADGSFDDVLGGHEKSIVSPEVDEFEYSRSLTRGTPDDDVIVKMRDVRVSFKIGSLERVIIYHLNLDIKRGEILGLVGESGSGKTTIGRALMRINTVSGGEILFNNENLLTLKNSRMRELR